jgi:hypothetical protein
MIYIDKPGNFLHGYTVHRARKAGKCEYGRRVTGGPRCTNEIKVGDLYVAGEADGYYAGGFGRLRYCAECCAHHGIILAEQVPA